MVDDVVAVRGPLRNKILLTAASALETVGFEMMTHSASWVWDRVLCGVLFAGSRHDRLAHGRGRSLARSRYQLDGTAAGTT